MLRFQCCKVVRYRELGTVPYKGCGAGAGLFWVIWSRSRLRTKLKISFLNGRKYVKVSKKYAESVDM